VSCAARSGGGRGRGTAEREREGRGGGGGMSGGIKGAEGRGMGCAQGTDVWVGARACLSTG